MKKVMTAAEYLTHAMYLSGKTQREISQEAGFKSPNVMSMMKQGITKIPIYKVPDIAKACTVDPAYFVQLVMREYHPEIWKVISDHTGEFLTEEEKACLEEFRSAKLQERLSA